MGQRRDSRSTQNPPHQQHPKHQPYYCPICALWGLYRGEEVWSGSRGCWEEGRASPGV